MRPARTQAGGFWDQFHINHAKPDARGFSRDRLDALAESCGVALPLDDTDQLIDRVSKATVEIEKKEGYDAKNKVRRYLRPSEPLAQPDQETGDVKLASRSARQRQRSELDDDIPF